VNNTSCFVLLSKCEPNSAPFNAKNDTVKY